MWILLITVTSIAVFFIYPKVDARKYSGHFGSTADDVFILSANSLKETGKIYDVSLDALSPTSPGPGWIILNSFFVYTDMYALFMVVYFILALFLVNRFTSTLNANLFYLLCSSSLLFWELLFNGHDIIPLSFALFTGIFATSRVIFTILPIVLCISSFRADKEKSLLFLFISLSVCFGFHTYFYCINNYYQPFHLFFKAYRLLGIELITIISLLIILSGIFFIKESGKIKIKPIQLIFITYAFILFPVALMDLIHVKFDFTVWEGANYIYPLIPLYVYNNIVKDRLDLHQI